MRKSLFFFISLLLLIVNVGCNVLDPSKENVQEGRVIAISDPRILVVSDITKEEAIDASQEKIGNESVWYSVLDEGNEAIWYTVDDVSIYEIGQLIRIEWEHINDSYPGQSAPVKVQFLKE